MERGAGPTGDRGGRIAGARRLPARGAQASCVRPRRVDSHPAARGAGSQLHVSRAVGAAAAGCGSPRSRRAAAVARSPPLAASHCTRIKPPGDVIKLADRLHYLLQPSLESLLAEGSLAFPFRPFPFQFEGIAFLYPRQAAILADEMGLGKTMQAITAIRLLAPPRRGAQRAAGLPQAAGDQLAAGVRRLGAGGAADGRSKATRPSAAGSGRCPTCRCGSPTTNCCCAIATLLGRRTGIFDLVVLDESQRIKNRSSSTNEVVCSISRKRNWALTGTPVENSADDLLGIFEFLAPGFLSPEMKPRSMGRTIRDYVLRRTKDQVLSDLPPKLIHDEPLDLDARAARELPAGRGGGRACG